MCFQKPALLLLSSLLSNYALAAPLGWRECLVETRQGNPEIRAAQESLKASRYTKYSTYTGFLPHVAANLNYSHGNALSSAGLSSNLPLDSGSGTTIDRYTASVTANQNVFSGLQDKAKLDQAIAAVQSSEANLESIQAKVSHDLKVAYAGLLFAQKSESLYREIIERRQINLRLVDLRFKGGRENKGSVLLSEAYLEQAKFDVLQARNNLQVYRAQLAKVLGRDEESEFTLNEDVPLLKPSDQPDFKALVVRTPDHLQAVAQEDGAQAGLMSARSGFFPTLGLNASVSNSDTHWFPGNHRWSIGATLSLPLFDGGRDYFASRSASASLRAASHNRMNIDRVLLAKLKQTHSAYVEAVQKLKVDHSFLAAALKRSEIARSKYNNGLMTFEDWDIIENDLINRQKAVLQSARDLVVSESSWMQAMGAGVLQ